MKRYIPLTTTITIMLSLYKSSATFTISTLLKSSKNRAPKKTLYKISSTFSSAIRSTSSTDNNASNSSYSRNNKTANKHITVKHALQNATQQLMDHGIVEPDFSALHLLAHASKVHFSEVMATPHRVMNGPDLELFRDLVRRRLEHEPIQYIIGEWDFMDFTIKCRAPTLCPRPETEELVEHVIHQIQNDQQQHKDNDNNPIQILDVGCGTGAIGIALARAFPQAEVTAIDIAPEAVALSNENARLLQLSDARYKAQLCSAADFTTEASTAATSVMKFDYVVSNPPYIPFNDMETLTPDVRDHEDFGALCGGDDGLNVVRDIVAMLPQWAGESKCTCWMEVDVSHPIMIRDWIGGSGNDDVKFVEYRQDLCGRDRFVRLEVS